MKLIIFISLLVIAYCGNVTISNWKHSNPKCYLNIGVHQYKTGRILGYFPHITNATIDIDHSMLPIFITFFNIPDINICKSLNRILEFNHINTRYIGIDNIYIYTLSSNVIHNIGHITTDYMNGGIIIDK